MSNYTRTTKNPFTSKWEEADWLDDHFGKHNYGVKFKDGTVVDPRDVEVETRDEK